MKNKILTKLAVCASIALMAFTSCNTDAEGVIYTPDETAAYSFAAAQMNVELTADNEGKLKVPVYRSTTTGDAIITITADMNETTASTFTLASSAISFADGEGMAYAELDFGSIDNLGVTTKYIITLSIAEENQSPSAEGSIEVQAQRLLTWESYGTGVYTSENFEESWSQPIEKAAEGNIYRLPDCITQGYPLVFTLSEDGQSLAGFDIQATGVVYGTYGMTYFVYQGGASMEGKTLNIPLYLCIILQGQYVPIYGEAYVETIEFP